MSTDSNAHPQTKAIHEGVYQDSEFNSVTTPIYASSTFHFDSVSSPPKFDYTRSGNPTRQALNDNIAALEGGHAAFSTSSGMSAIHTALMILKAGDHVVCGHEIYGGTHRLFSQVLPKLGITFSYVDMTDPKNVENALTENTQLIYIETPTNPLLNLVDIEAIVKIAKAKNCLTAIDNTFLTPILQQPISLGIDLVIHSTTKYLNGHSDMVGGAIITRTEELTERIAFLVNALGTGLAPFDSWLALRGIKTLVPRMKVHQENASAIVEFLGTQSCVKQIFYPGLSTHPNHAIAKKQQNGFGGMLSLELDTDIIDIDRFFKNLKYFNLCVSLGGVESLIEQPWSMSHIAMPESARRAAGITPGIIRISAGTEHTEDLVNDLQQSLNASKK